MTDSSHSKSASAKPIHVRYRAEYEAWLKMLVDAHVDEIGIDPRWAISFEAFLNDMGPMPRTVTIERKETH